MPTIPLFPEIFGVLGFNPTDNCWNALAQPSITAATLTLPLDVPIYASILSTVAVPVQSEGNDQI